VTPATEAAEERTYARVTWRLLPFLGACYLVAYLDRVNVGFAKLHMLGDLGMSEAAYGFGAGVFFFGYFLFELPSNLALHRIGARVWIARIMVTWGVVSGAMAFTGTLAQLTGLGTDTVFYSLRFLLGVAEAGFFPAVLFYLTLWVPERQRVGALGMFVMAQPLANAIGACSRSGSRSRPAPSTTIRCATCSRSRRCGCSPSSIF
jgi:MFS family permease